MYWDGYFRVDISVLVRLLMMMCVCVCKLILTIEFKKKKTTVLYTLGTVDWKGLSLAQLNSALLYNIIHHDIDLHSEVQGPTSLVVCT